MYILHNLIFYSKFTHINKCPAYDIQDPETNFYITKINCNHRTRWRKKAIVPWPIIHIFGNWGIDLGLGTEKKGIKLNIFLELLWGFCLNNEYNHNARSAALFIYEDTVKCEIKSKRL